MLKGIGKKRSEEFESQGIYTIEQLSQATKLTPTQEKYQKAAIEYLQSKGITTVSTTTTHNTSSEEVDETSENVCMNYVFDKHTWLGKQVKIPVGANNVIHNAIIKELLLEHGERLVILCKDMVTKKTSFWQIPTLATLNFELPPLRITLSEADMELIQHNLEYILSTLWQSDYIRSCIQPE